DVAELAGRGVVEGEDDRAGAGGQRDLAVEVVGEGDGAIAALPEAGQVTLEVLGRARPAGLGVVDLVVLEDHHAPDLVGGQRGGLGPGQDGRAQADREQDGRDDGTHGYWVDF